MECSEVFFFYIIIVIMTSGTVVGLSERFTGIGVIIDTFRNVETITKVTCSLWYVRLSVIKYWTCWLLLWYIQTYIHTYIKFKTPCYFALVSDNIFNTVTFTYDSCIRSIEMSRYYSMMAIEPMRRWLRM